MPASSTAERGATLILVCCALLMTGLVARRELAGGDRPLPPAPAPYLIEQWDHIQSGGSILAGAGGKITLVEFSDFECPYCGRFRRTLDSVIAEYPIELRVIYRHFPLTRLHRNARDAAAASECAAQQTRFREYHDALFTDQAGLGRVAWAGIASRVGLDTLEFNLCLRDGRAEPRLAEDLILVSRLGLVGTPTVILNGWVLPGTPSGPQLRQFINRELGR